MLPNKKKLSFLPILLLLTVFTTDMQGQNYALFNKDRYMNYTKQDTAEADSIYYFAKIDSVVFDGIDSIFYFNHPLDTVTDGSCFAVNGDTIMLGNKMIKRNDVFKTHVFFNKNGDSIFIRQNIQEDDVWHMFTWPDGTYISATVINKVAFSPLPETPDSIYSIHLSVFTLGGINLPDSFPNNTRIYLSKNHGLIQFWDLNQFPSPIDTLPYVLRGLTNFDEYKADVHSKNAFDFELGYEFHFREEVAPDLASGADKRISAWKYFVMEKQEAPTGFTYKMERILFDTLYLDDLPSSNVTWDTVDITYTFSDYAILDTLELNLFQATNFGYSDWVQQDTIYKGIPHKYVYDWFEYDDETGCLSNPANINQPEQLYGDGLGLMHYLDSTDINNYYKFDMVYFHLGLLEWGEPYDFSGLDLSIHAAINNLNSKIYPNPASNILNISIPNNLEEVTFEVYSVEGNKKMEGILSGENNNLNIVDLTDGLYILSLKSNGQTYYHRFVKLSK